MMGTEYKVQTREHVTVPSTSTLPKQRIETDDVRGFDDRIPIALVSFASAVTAGRPHSTPIMPISKLQPT